MSSSPRGFNEASGTEFPSAAGVAALSPAPDSAAGGQTAPAQPSEPDLTPDAETMLSQMNPVTSARRWWSLSFRT